MSRKPLNRTHCTDCNVELNDINTVIYGGYKKGKCRECYNKNHAKQYDFERDRAHNLKRKFGMSLDDYSKMFDAQLGKCAVCLESSDKTLHVDHNHLTGEVRALLCQRCNHTIGLLKENPDLIMKMYEYLVNTTWNKGLDSLKIGKKNA